jgi:cytochrome c556
MKGQHPLTALKIFVVVVSLGLTTGSTIAQEKKVVDNYRSSVMSGIDAHMQSIKAITEGKVPLWHHLPDHAVAIVGTSRSLLEIFPDKMSKTNGDAAKREIMPSFKDAAMRFNGEAARLVQIIPSGNRDAVTAQSKVLAEAYDKLRQEIAAPSAEKTSAEKKETTSPTTTTTTPTPAAKPATRE